MLDHIVDASEPQGRVDIQLGAGRRRRWSDEIKGRIVAESYAPGAVVLDVARRHVSPQHLFAWRKAAGAGLLSLRPTRCCCSLRSSRSLAAMECAGASAGDIAAITIEIGGAVVRAARGADPAWLRDVLRTVKAAT
jgi:transposase